MRDIPERELNRTRYLEIGGVIATAIGKIVVMDLLHWRLIFIATTIVCWTVYIVKRQGVDPGSLRRWGFRMDNRGEALRILVPFAVTAVVACVIIGYFRNTINFTWHIFPVLILYPIWGTIQQFLVISLVAGNLQDMKKKELNERLIILVTALLFGLVHYHNLWLVAGTFILALLYGYVFLRVRNVFILGLFHGWLGALFFYTVVGRDPFQEVFGRYLQ